MGLHHEPLFTGRDASIRVVHCHPTDAGESGTEYVDGFQLVFPIAGRFRLHASRRDSFVVDPAHVLCLPPDQPHRYSHPGSCSDVCLSVELGRSLLDGCLDVHDPSAADRAVPCTVHRALLPQAALRRRALFEHRLRAGVTDALEVEETVLQLVADWLAARGRPAPARPRRASTRRDHRERVAAVQLLLAADPGRAWTLGELGRRVYLSPCHLTTVFRRQTGLPVHRYLLRLRLAAALDAVLAGDRELTRVGADLGFASPSHFATCFRSAYGVPPSELRKKVTAPR